MIRPMPEKNSGRVFDAADYSAIMRALLGQLAQLVEQRIENPRVLGSIPRLATSIVKHLAQPFGWAKCFLRCVLTLI